MSSTFIFFFFFIVKKCSVHQSNVLWPGNFTGMPFFFVFICPLLLPARSTHPYSAIVPYVFHFSLLCLPPPQCLSLIPLMVSPISNCRTYMFEIIKNKESVSMKHAVSEKAFSICLSESGFFQLAWWPSVVLTFLQICFLYRLLIFYILSTSYLSLSHEFMHNNFWTPTY